MPLTKPRAAAKLAAKAGHALLSPWLLLLSWAISAFLDGCAAYALAMYGIPASLDDRHLDAGEAKSSQEARSSQGEQPHCAAPGRSHAASVIRLTRARDDRRRRA